MTSTTSAATGVEMEIRLQGLRCDIQHGPSGAHLATVPPKDNGGDGSSFSPTDLLAASLGACALSTMALQAGREGLSWGDASVRVVKIMGGPPRRVATVTLAFTMPVGVRPEHRARLEEVARGCPVARSLNSETTMPMTFVYP